MGQSASTNKQVAAHSPNFAPEVEIIKSVQDPHYGDVKLVKDKKTSQTMILKEIIVNTKEAFEQELIFYNNRVSLKHPNVVAIQGYTSEDKQNFCSTYFKVSVFIEVLEKNLLSELEHRKNEKRNYNENELLLVADSLIAGLSYFQNQQHSHGDIRPFNIFVQEHVYKLSDPSLAPQKGSTGLSLAIIHGTETLLAPELLAQVPQHKFETNANRTKADVFSLGATLLALATLSHSEDLYDYKTGKINSELLDERLAHVKSHYCEFTYDLIRSMLAEEPTGRPDFTALTEKLLPYVDDIRNFCLDFTHNPHKPHPDVYIFEDNTQKPHPDVYLFDDHTQKPHPDVYLFDDHHHHHEEVVKKSAPVPQVHHEYTSTYQPATTSVPVDDLEARIKAAMERTQATFKAVAIKENEQYTSTAPITTTHDIHNITYSHYTPQVEQVHKSAAPTVDVHHSYVAPITTTYDIHNITYSHHTPQVEQVHKSAAPTVDVHHSYVAPVTTHDAYSHLTTTKVGEYTSPLQYTSTTTTAPLSYTAHNPLAHDVTASYIASEKERALRSSLPADHITETVQAPQTFGTTDYGITSTQPASHYTTTSYVAPTTSYSYTATPAVDIEKLLKSSNYQPATQDYTSSYTSSYVPYTSSYTTSTYTAQPQSYTTTTAQPVSYTSHHYSSDVAGLTQPQGYTQDPLSQVYSSEVQKLINTYSLGGAHHTTDYTSPSYNVTTTVTADHHHHVEPVVSHEEQHHHVEVVAPAVEEHHHHEVAQVEPCVPVHEEHHQAHEQLLQGEQVNAHSAHQSPVHVREEVHHQEDHCSPVHEVQGTPGRNEAEGCHEEQQVEHHHQVEAEVHSEH